MKKVISILLVVLIIALTISVALVPAFAENTFDVDKNDLMFAEYAEIGDGVYFDTGYITDGKTTLLMDVNVKSDNEIWFDERKECYYLFHDEGMHLLDYTYMYFKLTRNHENIECGYGDKNTIIDVGNLQNGRHTIQLGSEGFYLDKNKKFQSNKGFFQVKKDDGIIYNTSQPYTFLYLFCTHETTYNEHDHVTYRLNLDTHESVTDAGNVTFYNCRIYDYSELVHDFVPAVIKSNNKSVIYDVVTDTVYEYSIVNGKSNGDASDNVVSYNLSDTLYPEENSIVTNNAGFTLSSGNLWILIIGAVVILGAVTLIVVVAVNKKKKEKNTN